RLRAHRVDRALGRDERLAQHPLELPVAPQVGLELLDPLAQVLALGPDLAVRAGDALELLAHAAARIAKRPAAEAQVTDLDGRDAHRHALFAACGAVPASSRGC